MILKAEAVSGAAMASLMRFLHNEENWMPNTGGRVVPVVEVKMMEGCKHNPNHDNLPRTYKLTLEIAEWDPKGNRIEAKYLLRVYEILGKVGEASQQA